MKVVLAQINTTPGDFNQNVESIIDGINYAGNHNADMVVFPELAIPGYLTCDKMFQKNYVKKNRKCLHDLITYSLNFPDLYIVVGYIGQNNTGCGKPFANLLAVINDGTLIGKYQKRLIPNHDVFDEYRYYEPGKKPLILDIKDERIFFAICEDLWTGDKGETGILRYDNNPVNDFKNSDASMLVSINASPYALGKIETRNRMLCNICPSDRKLIYVNTQGGQDELVFDGNSCLIRENSVVYQIAFEENVNVLKDNNYKLIDTDSNFIFKPSFNSPWVELKTVITTGLRDYVNKCGFEKVIVGSSGGIDSALTIALACDALGPENVTGVIMPSIYSSDGSVTDAQELHKKLGCNEMIVPIEHMDLLNKINEQTKLNDFENYNSVADQNIQARIRGLTLMHISNVTNQLVLTTGNKTECAVGYFTLYGDSCGSFNPIKDLYKTQVYGLAKYMSLPGSIIKKEPSAELEENQKDEDQLLPYNLLDLIVKGFIEEYIDEYDDFVKWIEETKYFDFGMNYYEFEEYKKTIENIQIRYYDFINMINKNEFKRRQTALGVKLSKVAFGTGRRLPIAGK